MASGRNFKDIYELETKFPNEQVKSFAESLGRLKEAFESIKAAGKSGILSSLRMFTGEKSVQGATQFGDALFRVAGAIQWIGKAIESTSPAIHKLGEDLRSISGIKIEPQIVLSQDGDQENIAKKAEKVSRAAIKSYKNLSEVAVAELMKIIRTQGAIGDNKGVEALTFALVQLLGNSNDLTTVFSKLQSSIRGVNTALRDKTSLADEQKAALAVILQEQEARDTLRSSVEGTLAAYQREQGILPNIKQARKDLTELLKVEGVTGEQAETLMKKRLDMLKALGRAEQQAAVERKVAADAQRAATDQIASNAVVRALDQGILSANNASKAYRSVAESLKGFQGSATDAAAIADKLASSFAKISSAEKQVSGQAATGRIAEEERLTRLLIDQLAKTKEINLENARMPAIVKQVVTLQMAHNLTLAQAVEATKNLLRTEEQRERVGRGRAQRELSTFAELGVLSIVSTRITQSLRLMVSQFATFEQSLTEVRKTANATTQQMEALGRNLLNISQIIPITAAEFAQIAGVLGQVGAIDAAGKSIDGFAASASRAVELVAQISIATNLSAEEAAKSFGQFRAIFTKDVERLKGQLTLLTGVTADTTDALRAMFGALNEVSDQTVATVSDLNQFIQAFGGVATSAGVAFERIASLGGVVADLGVSLPVAGTAMSRLFQDAIRRADVFADVVGTSTREWINLFTVDAEEAILRFIEGLGRMDVAEKTRVLTQIAARQRLQQVIVKLADATVKQSAAQQTLREQLQKTDSLAQNFVSVQEEAEKFSETWNATLNRLSNSITAVGAAMQPVLRTVVVFLDAISGIVTSIVTFPGVGPLLGSLLAIGAAFAAVVLKIRLLTLTYGLVMGSGQSLIKVFAGLTGAAITNSSATATATQATNSLVKSQTLAASIGRILISTNIATSGTFQRLGSSILVAVGAISRYSRAISGVGLVASVAGNALGSGFLSSIGNLTLSIGILIPLLEKATLAIKSFIGAKGGLSAAFAATSIKAGAFFAVLKVGVVAIASFVAAVATAPLTLVALGVAVAALLAQLAFNRNKVRSFTADIIVMRELGEAGWFTGLLASLVELRHRLLGLGEATDSFKKSMVELIQASREVQAATAKALDPFLRSLGLSNTELQLITTAIGSGAAQLSNFMGKTREEVKKTLEENRRFYQSIIQVQEALKDQGKSAQEVAEIFSDFDGTVEGLIKLARSQGVILDRDTLVKGLTAAGEVAEQSADSVTKLSKALTAARTRASELAGSVSRVEGFELPTPTVEDIERLALVVRDYKDVSELQDSINKKNEFFSGTLESINNQKEAYSAELARSLSLESDLESSLSAQEGLLKASGGDLASNTKAIVIQIGLLEGQLALQKSITVQNRETLKALEEERAGAVALRDLARERLEEDRLRLLGALAKKELEVKQKQQKAEVDLVKRFQDSFLAEQIKSQSDTAQALFQINQSYYKDLETLREANFRDESRLQSALLSLQQTRFARIGQLYADLAKKRAEALQKEISQESEGLRREQATLSSNIVKAVEEYSKALEKAIKESEEAAKKALEEVEQATRGFTKGIFSLLDGLNDPYAKFTQGLRAVVDEIKSLIDFAVTLGDDNRVLQAFELGAEAIRRQAFEAGKALGDLQVQRRKINEESSKLDRKEQQLLLRFRDAYVKNLEDQDITEVERGRRASLLRDRAEQLGIGDIATKIADVFDSERMLEAIREQADVQRRIEENARQQLDALQALVEQGRAAPPAEDPKAAVDAARADLERAEALRRKAEALQPEEGEKSLEGMLQAMRDNAAQLADNDARLAAVAESAESVNSVFRETFATVGSFNEAVGKAAGQLRSLGISESDIAEAGARSTVDTIGDTGDVVRQSFERDVQAGLERLGANTKAAEDTALEVLKATNENLEQMVQRMEQMNRRIDENRRRITESDVQNSRAQQAAAVGSEE